MEPDRTIKPCDPDLLSCITPQEIQLALPVVAATLLALGIWGLIRHERRKHLGLMPKRGTAPGRGETLIYAGETLPTGTGNFDASRVYRVSQDPKDHTRAMMPAKARKKDKP